MSECEKCGGNHFHRTSNGMIVQCECISDAAYDAVNRPAHYAQGDIECIDAIKSAVADLRGVEAYMTGTIIKYVWRWRAKNGAEDLRKARWFIDNLIEETRDGK
tara:strand:- start:55 stop:366 length:312 start_codon:yes stop_codon:yes gene_type:complete